MRPSPAAIPTIERRRRTPADAGPATTPDMTRERARTERRDLDKERGEPLAGGAARRRTAGAADDCPAARRMDEPAADPHHQRRRRRVARPARPQAGARPDRRLTVVAPDTNQSAVGHQKTLMRPLRVRERTLGDGSLAYSVDGSPTDAVSLAFLGYFGHGFDLVAAGINYGANLGDDITYSGTVSAAMEAVINSCPAFAISQEYYEHPDFALAGRRPRRGRPQHPRARPVAGRAHQRQRAGGRARGVRRVRGDPPRASGSTRTSSSSGSTRAASPTSGSAGRRRPGWPSRAPTSTRSSTGGSPSRRSTSTSPAGAS